MLYYHEAIELYELICDRCDRTIRTGIDMLSAENARKLAVKRKFCGRCIDRRLRKYRENPECDY